MGYIYLVTNKVNNKQYIGQSICKDIKSRWKQHKVKDSKTIGNYLLSAYNKYGINNFTYKIICICFDEDCNKYEEEYIKKYNTLAPYGYNLREGGYNTKHHPETIKLISEKLKGRKLSIEHCKKIAERNRNKKITNETKNKLSISLMKEKNSQYGRKYSDEEKKNLSLNIRKGLKIKKKNGYNIKENSLNNLKESSKKRCKKINQYNIDGILINTYNSITEASIKNNISQTTISDICNNKTKSNIYKDFIYKFTS